MSTHFSHVVVHIFQRTNISCDSRVQCTNCVLRSICQFLTRNRNAVLDLRPITTNELKQCIVGLGYRIVGRGRINELVVLVDENKGSSFIVDVWSCLENTGCA